MPAHILAIDETDQSSSQIRMFLTGDEFEVHSVRPGREVRDLVDREDFDLVLLDLAPSSRVPVPVEVWSDLRANQRIAQIPVLVLTARPDDPSELLPAAGAAGAAGDAGDAGDAGEIEFLGKPFQKRELLRRVHILLRHRQRRIELETRNFQIATGLQQLRRNVDRLREELHERRDLERAEVAAFTGRLVVDRDGWVIEADPAVTALAGGQLAGRLLDDSDHPLPRALCEFARNGAARAELRLGDGPVRHFEVERTLIGESLSMIRIRDVTETQAIRARIESQRVVHLRLHQDRFDGADEFRSGAHGDGQGVDRPYRMSGMVGEARSLHDLCAVVGQLRNVRSTVLIQGETGTGKELVARALHFDGKFGGRPFIPIHCGAISPELIESELFGYEKGAFTGALTRKDGLFTAADGGTVFLDEVAETPPDLQVKLLRVLQLGEIRPVGSNHARHVDVRIIAATNRDLGRLVRDGQFREDLYYRLDVVTIHLPALRDRVDDIPRLSAHFIDKLNRVHAREYPVRGISRGALRALEAYSWPGNVRELENVVNGAISLGCGEILQETDLPRRILDGDPSAPEFPARNGNGNGNGTGKGLRGRDGVFGAAPTAGSGPPPCVDLLKARRDRMDKVAIIDALSRFQGDKCRAALFLGVSRSTFYRKLKAHGMT